MTSASHIFTLRSDAKIAKHKGFSSDANGTKGFVAIVVNNYGAMGPDAFWSWFDGAFAEAALGDIREGATGRSALQRKSVALQTAQASLMRATAEMVSSSAAAAAPQ